MTMMTAASCLLTMLLILLLGLLPKTTLAGSGCEEAKCRGTRIHPWVDNDLEFTCWIPLSQVENVTHESYCADGYVGHYIPEVPTTVIDDEERGWYTCCPPDFEGEAYQRCTYTDCASPDWATGGNCWADGFQEPMSCGSSTFRYPHYSSQKSLIYYQFLCCDSQPSTSDNYVTQELVIARSIWMALSFITLVFCSVFLVALLTSPTAMSEGWNVYLAFLAFPDALANLIILIRNSLTIPGVPVSPTLHVFFAAFEYFYVSTNLWLNGVIIYQLHYVLRNSGPNRATMPAPSVQLVWRQSLTVYGLGFVVFCWAFYLYHRALLDFTLDATINIWIATRSMLICPVFLYICYVCFDVYRSDLLPKSGRTRVLSLYFLRVVIVFMFTWIPHFILYEIAWSITYSSWTVYVSYFLCSIQGAASVMVALSKPDVKKAFFRLLGPIANRLGYSVKKSRKKKTKAKKDLRRTDTRSIGDVVSLGAASEAVTSSSVDDDGHDPNNEWNKEDDWGTIDIEAILDKDDPKGPEKAPTIIPRLLPSGFGKKRAKRSGNKKVIVSDKKDGNSSGEDAVETAAAIVDTEDSSSGSPSEEKEEESFESRIQRIRREREERINAMAEKVREKKAPNQDEEVGHEAFHDEEVKGTQQPTSS